MVVAIGSPRDGFTFDLDGEFDSVCVPVAAPPYTDVQASWVYCYYDAMTGEYLGGWDHHALDSTP